MVHKCGLATCCCLLLVSIILIASSWDSLEIDEYGLDYSTFSKTVDSDPYSEGRYFLGLGHSFVTFPKTLQTIEFSTHSRSPQLKGRTSDGLLVELEVSFQYRLLQEEIFDLYNEYGTHYLPVFLKTARAVLVSLASEYTAYDFFSERQQIAAAMHDELKTLFSHNLHAVVQFFQLRDVNLPDMFEKAIEEAQVAAQTIERVKHERETVRVQTRTKIMQAEYQANITLTIARSTAEALLLRNLAEVDVFTFTQEKRAEAYGMLKNTTGLTTPQMLDYIKIQALSHHNESMLTVGLSGV